MDDEEPVYTPSDFIRYVAESRKIPVETFSVPERVLITYQRSTYDLATKMVNGKPPDWWIYGDAQPFCVGRFGDIDIGIGRLWIGAPAATMTLEELIVCGAKTVFEVGLSGGLQEFLKPGDIVVVTEAVRDEGTSQHYLPAGVRVEASRRFRELLVSILDGKGIKHFLGPAWSTDGVYRETRAKFRRFKTAGVMVVDMETSAVFSLAKYRNVEAASAQVISDVLTESGWRQAWRDQSLVENTELLLDCVLETLSRS